MTPETPEPQRYLLVPMHPTPNGRLHIGHAAGAYLRADVLARHLRREGHQVSVMSGSDAYENWILLDALDAGRSPAETCWRFHALIGDDLRSLGVELDDWISPLADDHAEPYRRTHEELLERLAAAGTAVKVPDPTPRSRDTGRHVIGVWLKGTCPQCHTPGGGNACEECGYHYQPSEILEPYSRLDEGPLDWEDFDSWYLSPPSVEDVVDAVRASDVASDFADIAVTYLRQTKGAVRLSQPGSWGIPSELAGPEGVLSNPYFGFSLYCGEVYRQRHGTEHNAFHRDSGVITVGLFGIDNAVGGVAASQALAHAHGELKAFDHMVTNYFLDFEGEKCSTSRKHGIWLNELLSRTSATADELRYHLSHVDLTTGSDNFAVAAFVDSVNHVRERLAAAAHQAQEAGGGALPAEDAARIAAAVHEQGAQLRPGAAVSLPAAVRVLDEWLTRPPVTGAAWATGVALLAEPFMPEAAQRLWTALGRPGRPRLAGLDRASGPAVPAAPVPPQTFTADEIAPVCHVRSN
ncbi:class I tRNA ligase family protein [Streptomyces lydicus]|uniref:class I tRNA ligase family protein n=1 Tax=Streptomyces lydicus TaxID=47763 RepID=UPI00381B7554